MMEAPILHPEWRHALRQIIDLDPQPGDVLPREWLEELLDLPPARDMAGFQARSLKWLQRFEKLRDELLTTHQIWLRAAEGGYEVVPPASQTETAYSDYSRAAMLKLKRMVRVARNVRLSELTDEQRRANADSLAKMSMLVGMVGTAVLEDKRADEGQDAA
jgi:hypothetical protein